MKSLHYAMMGVALIGLLALSLGVTQPLMSTALAQHGHGDSAAMQHGDGGEGQHGHGDDVGEHFDAFATHLELSAEQKELISAPFHEAFNSLQNVQRLHGMIAAELTDAQQQQLQQMVHEMLGTLLQEHQD